MPPRRARIAKTFTFHAAHQLLHHQGACSRPHGHTYTAEVEVEGVVSEAHQEPDEGMVTDFDVLKDAWREHVDPHVDHQDLNDTLGKRGCWPTTAENIAWWIAEQLLAAGLAVSQVTVWETPTSRATVRPA